MSPSCSKSAPSRRPCSTLTRPRSSPQTLSASRSARSRQAASSTATLSAWPPLTCVHARAWKQGGTRDVGAHARLCPPSLPCSPRPPFFFSASLPFLALWFLDCLLLPRMLSHVRRCLLHHRRPQGAQKVRDRPWQRGRCTDRCLLRLARPLARPDRLLNRVLLFFLLLARAAVGLGGSVDR